MVDSQPLERDVEVFEPGTRVRMKGAPQGYVFLVVVGGYVVEDGWVFHSSATGTFTTKLFERVEA